MRRDSADSELASMYSKEAPDRPSGSKDLLSMLQGPQPLDLGVPGGYDLFNTREAVRQGEQA